MKALDFRLHSDPGPVVKQATLDFVEKARILQRKIGKDVPSVNFVFPYNFVSNSTLVIARCFMDLLIQEGIKISATNKTASSFNYANRLGFFEDVEGYPYEKTKHDAAGRFIELEKITPSDASVTNRVKNSLKVYSEREGVYISDDTIDLLLYSIGELVSNVRRHSGTSGRISFQHLTDCNEITVCDFGIGIIDHLRSAGFTGTDEELLLKSIDAYVSSSHKIGHTYQEDSPGVGLFNLTRIAEVNDDTSVTILTKNLKLTISKNRPRVTPLISELDYIYQGTIVVIRIPNNVPVSLNKVLEESLQGNNFF